MRWYNNLERRSKVTAGVYLRRLGNFCQRNQLTSKQLAQMDEETATNLVLDLVSDLQERGNAGSYVESIVKAVKSWLKKNKRSLGDIYIEDTEETPCKMSRFPPSKNS